MGGADIYKVVVDYAMSLPDMIAAGRYDWTNRDITAENFPFSGEGQKKVDLELIHLNRDASTKEVLEELDRRDLRPGTIEELLALGAKYLELQKKFPIIAFGSVWRVPNGGRVVLYLYWSGIERSLDLDDDDARRWDDDCRFLAVRK